MAKFEFNERAVKKLQREAVKKLADNLTVGLNALITTHQGQPVEKVRTAVQRVWKEKSGGGSITEPDLTTFAESIAAGRPVTVNAD